MFVCYSWTGHTQYPRLLNQHKISTFGIYHVASLIYFGVRVTLPEVNKNDDDIARILRQGERSSYVWSSGCVWRMSYMVLHICTLLHICTQSTCYTVCHIHADYIPFKTFQRFTL
jgi:hypothetical protein